MIYYINNETDAYYNLALEEVLLKSDLADDVFLLWQNHNSIIVGCNQNTLSEINYQQVIADNVKVVRRLTGGGTVFHDKGNLNFTFIKQNANNRNYETLLDPIIKVLNQLNVPAAFCGKNDLEVMGKKISGNAQYLYHNRLLHHGTLLYDVDLTKMPKYLTVNEQKMQSKKIKSTAARVTNIKPLLAPALTIEEFKTQILNYLASQEIKISLVPSEIHQAAQKLAADKYAQWSWNFGKAMEFTYQNVQHFPNKGTIEVQLSVEEGFIKEIKFYGDFLGSLGTHLIEEQLVNCRYQRNDLLTIIQANDYHGIFGPQFKPEEIVSAIIE